jgi:flagellar hook-associated protein 2
MSLNSVLSSSQNQSDMLVESYKATQQPAINTLTDKRTLLQSRKSFFSVLNTRINSLSTQLDKFKASDVMDKFFAKSVSSSDTSVATATAKSDATLNNNSLKVERLASNDLLITSRLALADAFGEVAGTQTFAFTVGSTSKDVSVDFDGTETNEQAMKKIVQAINSTEDLEINASFVKDTSTTGRISLNSKNTGTDNRITFAQNSVLDKLGLNPDTLLSNTNTRVLTTDTTAGFKIADADTLDSKFELNGINITRSSNTIDDVLTGVTLNLLKTQKAEDAAITLTTTVNSESVQNFVKELLTSMNDIISNISNNRDIRRNESSVANLMQNLKNAALTKFNDGTGGPQYLVEIGIKFDNSGFLTISDTEKFKKALEENPQKLADMFAGENGLATIVSDIISPFKGSTGFVSEREKNLNTQIDYTSKRITETETRIDTQAESMRKQYQSYLKLFYDAQNQSAYLNGFVSTSGSSTGA